MSRGLRIANVLVVGLIVVYGAVEYAAPWAAASVWRQDYKDLMFKCDHAMREHFIAKRAVETSPGMQSVKNLKATELGLLDCHDYDKIRKKMLLWGVGQDRLSLIGLEALEEKKYELRRFVEIHEIRY